MAYNEKLADRIREALVDIQKVEEKKMFRGITFMVNGKMCVSVSGENLMCRFDPTLQETVSEKTGFQEMIMKGKTYKGYCYISPEGIKSKKDFDYWINLCLEFNSKAKASKKKVELNETSRHHNKCKSLRRKSVGNHTVELLINSGALTNSCASNPFFFFFFNFFFVMHNAWAA